MKSYSSLAPLGVAAIMLAGCSAGDPSPLSRVPVIVRASYDPESRTKYSDESGDGRIDRIRIMERHGDELDCLDTDFDGRWDLVRESKGRAYSSREPTQEDSRRIEESLDRYLKNQPYPRHVEAVARPAKHP